jgi:hypothetical protein
MGGVEVAMKPRYGPAHRALRAALLPFASGSPCTRCGNPIELGQPVDLDHADDGVRYLGWAHRSCNRRAGAIKGNRMRGQTKQGRISMTAKCALGVDIAHDRSHTSVVFATTVDDGRVLIELEYLDGSDTAEQVASLARGRPNLSGTVIDPRSPATTLLDPLRKLGVRAVEVNTREVALAHGLFLDELRAGRLRYVEHEALTAAAQFAIARPLAGAQALERQRVEVDASPMTAAELAVWALLRRAKTALFLAVT